MKFEYNDMRDERECVAYIDRHDHLIVKNHRAFTSENLSFVFMTTDGKDTTTMWDKFDPSDAIRKFYPGDKITITF